LPGLHGIYFEKKGRAEISKYKSASAVFAGGTFRQARHDAWSFYKARLRRSALAYRLMKPLRFTDTADEGEANRSVSGCLLVGCRP